MGMSLEELVAKYTDLELEKISRPHTIRGLKFMEQSDTMKAEDILRRAGELGNLDKQKEDINQGLQNAKWFQFIQKAQLKHQRGKIMVAKDKTAQALFSEHGISQTAAVNSADKLFRQAKKAGVIRNNLRDTSKIQGRQREIEGKFLEELSQGNSGKIRLPVNYGMNRDKANPEQREAMKRSESYFQKLAEQQRELENHQDKPKKSSPFNRKSSSRANSKDHAGADQKQPGEEEKKLKVLYQHRGR